MQLILVYLFQKAQYDTDKFGIKKKIDDADKKIPVILADLLKN